MLQAPHNNFANPSEWINLFHYLINSVADLSHGLNGNVAKCGFNSHGVTEVGARCASPKGDVVVRVIVVALLIDQMPELTETLRPGMARL
jgi:hypothetical protein